MSVELSDNSVKVKAALGEAASKWLYEASAILNSEVKQNTAVRTGQLKSSWAANVNEEKGEAVVGSPLENAVWEEFGTGEYALNGDGRKGGWFYEDEKGKGHFTRGKKPRRALHKAFETKKTFIIRRAEQTMKSEMG